MMHAWQNNLRKGEAGKAPTNRSDEITAPNPESAGGGVARKAELEGNRNLKGLIPAGKEKRWLETRRSAELGL